jgi:hypothetical protein
MSLPKTITYLVSYLIDSTILYHTFVLPRGKRHKRPANKRTLVPQEPPIFGLGFPYLRTTKSPFGPLEIRVGLVP